MQIHACHLIFLCCDRSHTEIVAGTMCNINHAFLFAWSIREMVTFLDPGFHERKQEEFDGDIKDRPTSLKDIKKFV